MSVPPGTERVRLALTAVHAGTGERLDVLLDIAPADQVAGLRHALAGLLPSAPPGLWLGGDRLDDGCSALDAGMRAGCELWLGGPAPPHHPDPSAGSVVLGVAGGPDAGAVHLLRYGRTVVGRAPMAGLRLHDARVSDRQLELTVTAAGVVATGLGASRVLLDGVPLVEPTPVGPGTLLTVGADLLTVTPYTAPDAALTPGPDLALEVNRPPRLRPEEPKTTVEVPVEPRPAEPRRLALLPLGLPVLVGLAMAFVLSPLFLLFTLLSPVVALGTFWSDRRSGRAGAVLARLEYAGARAEADQRIAAAAAAETARRRADHLDPATLLLTATGPGRRLWERRRDDPDALLLRVGTGTGKAYSVRLASAGLGGTAPGVPELPDVPVLVALREVGVLGLAGDRCDVRALARWLVGQTAVLHSPRDLRVVLLVDPAAPDAEADWSWLRWLPHGAPVDGQDCLALVGDSAGGLARRVVELTALVAARTRAIGESHGQPASRPPDLLVVLDGACGLRALPGLAQVLHDGPRVGVHALCLDDLERLLPAECAAVVTCDGGAWLTVRRSGHAPQSGVRADLVSASWGDQVARALAPLRDATADGPASTLPRSARLLDVLRLDPPTGPAVRSRWHLDGQTTSAVVGLAAAGPFRLDLLRDGPHALIAGTTGAGKSEFLQTLVASLAVANRPDALTFLLVDYKGGAAFADCARLPHTVGLVTDLDGHLAQRALGSLAAELTRRELLLGEVGAADLEAYGHRGARALPRLLIVIDEFASLAHELPDFIHGLVDIAQRGRSLGVHLVLATQRPGGVVSPEIRANTNLRIALRVTDAAESQDVLGSPDAASIGSSTPGRGYARTGHATLQAFQSARVGGPRPGPAAGHPAALTALPLPWSGVGLPPPRPVPTGTERDLGPTDLQLLVDAVRAAAADLPAQRSPWLPALPERVLLSSLSAHRAAGAERPRLQPVPYALADLPGQQAQRPVVLDLERGGHLLVAGAPRSGRSTLLRTLAGSVALTCHPADVHLYALDCGNGALRPLIGLPHCGAVVDGTQVDRADRLLARLWAEVARRHDLLAGHGYADIAEQRAATPAADRLPYLVLLVDRWEGFLSAFETVDAGRLTETFLRLLREGPGAGLRVVVAGDRSVLLGKLASAIEDRLCLRLADRSDYPLAGLSPRALPKKIGPGRGFRGDSGVEVQVALLGDDASGAGQAAVLGEVGASWTSLPGAPGCGRPFRVDALPARVTYAALAAFAATSTCPAPVAAGGVASGPSGLRVSLGVCGDDLAVAEVDLGLVGPGFTIGGPPRSGRSTALLAVARSLLAAGTGLCVLAPRPSPLRALAGRPGVLAVLTTADPPPEELAAALNTAHGPFVVLVDDAERLHESDVEHLLRQVLRDGRDLGHCLVVAGTTDELAAAFRGFTADARRSRSGLLLCPASHLHGELLGVRLPRSACFDGPPGRGLLITPGQLTALQVAIP